MSTQPVPRVSRADVDRIVRRDFPADREAEVFALLDEYGGEGGHRARSRVHLAALKLAAGRIEVLRGRIEDAKGDPRDVIAAAEYPGYKGQGSGIDSRSAEERQRIIDAHRC